MKKEREATDKSKAPDKQSVEKEVDDKEYSCLVRAVCGDIKISTLVRMNYNYLWLNSIYH